VSENFTETLKQSMFWNKVFKVLNFEAKIEFKKYFFIFVIATLVVNSVMSCKRRENYIPWMVYF